MIVNYTAAGWQIITQRTHGLLAAQICAHWKKEKQPKRWAETLIATAEHDDVYNEFDNDDLLNDNGGPVDFKTTSFKQGYGVRHIEKAITKSCWISLLVSRHIQFVHGDDPNADGFIKQLRKQEKAWMRTIKVTETEVNAGYELLEFCDAFSLIICQNLIQPEQRKIEISNGPDGKVYVLHANELNKLIVQPWPFEIPAFKVSYESRTLPQLAFSSSTAFRKKLFATAPISHELVISHQ